ncbi:uncharacterized protein LOC134285156 [Aedes albopictus]|uniref:Uncharacterized protein n=1 Tax=Aedes albopictus TaxID=7160 RepID=A0ABM1XNI0_AEDAL
MVVPKRSATPITFEKSATPSKLPRPTSRKAQPSPPLSSPARDFKPPTSGAAAAKTPSIADASSAIFDLNGRRVRKNSMQDAVTSASVDLNPDTTSSSVTPNDEDRCVDMDHPPREDHLQPDGEVFTLPKLRLNRATTFLGKANASKEAPEKDLIGDGNLAVSDYIQQPREQTPSSSTTSEPDAQLRRVISQCSFVNICPGGECRKEDSPPAAGGGQCCPSYWVTFLTCLVMLLSTVSLAITLLVSYDHLMALYYAWFHEDLTLSLEVSEGHLESFTDLMLKFWVALKRMIGLEG